MDPNNLEIREIYFDEKTQEWRDVDKKGFGKAMNKIICFLGLHCFSWKYDVDEKGQRIRYCSNCFLAQKRINGVDGWDWCDTN